jgi:hypothetical protein
MYFSDGAFHVFGRAPLFDRLVDSEIILTVNHPRFLALAAVAINSGLVWNAVTFLRGTFQIAPERTSACFADAFRFAGHALAERPRLCGPFEAADRKSYAN